MRDKKPSTSERDLGRCAKRQDPTRGREITECPSPEADIEIDTSGLSGNQAPKRNSPGSHQDPPSATTRPSRKGASQSGGQPLDADQIRPTKLEGDGMSDMFRTLSTIHKGVDRKHISLVGETWRGNQRRGIWPTPGEDDETFVLLPPPCVLPPHLMPWRLTLNTWAETTKDARDRRRLPDSLKRTSLWSVAGPVLPADAAAWIITLGIDSGPERGQEGFTTPLLVAAAPEWFPQGGEVFFYGSSGEVLVHRCDGISMQIPREWWDKWAYGAMAVGALYFTV